MRLTVDAMIESRSYPFVVDTGAVDTVVPAEELHAMAVKSWGEVTVRVADGKTALWDSGYITVQVGDRRAIVPVLFGSDPGIYLLGASALSNLRLCVDVRSKRLVDSGCVAVCPTVAGEAQRQE